MTDAIDSPSSFWATVYDAEMRLGRGRPEDVFHVIEALEDLYELAEKIAAVIRLHDHDQAGLTHLAANDLREWLAEQEVGNE